jgi:hypothetical protein
MHEIVNLYFPTDIPKTPHVGERHDMFGEYQNRPRHQRKFPGAVTPWDHEISYQFNQHGYRCDEFDDRKDINVLSIGCSYVFGVGIPAHRRFSRIFCDLLAEHTGKEVADWNMGWPGASIGYVARIAALVIPLLRPSVLIINFPAMARREFFDVEGKEYKHLPGGDPMSLRAKSLYRTHMDLSSACEDIAQFFLKYKLIEGLAKLHQVQWVYSIANRMDDLEKYAAIKKHCTTGALVKSMEKLDVARDGSHPGVLSNKQHGINLFKGYEEHYVQENKRQGEALALLL